MNRRGNTLLIVLAFIVVLVAVAMGVSYLRWQSARQAAVVRVTALRAQQSAERQTQLTPLEYLAQRPTEGTWSRIAQGEDVLYRDEHGDWILIARDESKKATFAIAGIGVELVERTADAIEVRHGATTVRTGLGRHPVLLATPMGITERKLAETPAELLAALEKQPEKGRSVAQFVLARIVAGAGSD